VTPAILSLLALLVAIVLSCTSRINVGLLAIAFAWLIGTGPAGWRADQVMAGFPASLFITLTGVTLLFGLAEVNGTLERLARRVIRWSGGHPRVVPVVFFLAAGVLSSVGPGAISAVALLIPLAMAIGGQAGVPRVLTALMVANGANAGNLSPISAVGIIANSRMAEAGLGQHEFRVWFANFAAHLLVAIAAWLLFRRADEAPASSAAAAAGTDATGADVLSRPQRVTMVVIAAWPHLRPPPSSS
jgi:di/tricarboxylate transporter